MKEKAKSSVACNHHKVGFLGLLITLDIVFGDIFYVVFLGIIIHYVIDCVRVCQNSLILKKSQSPDFHKPGLCYV